jgi:hypothetical protein
MKISIGSKVIEGPFGGGNEFIKNLINFFLERGHTVVDSLEDEDIDIILLTNPLINSETSTFNNFDIDYYVKFKNPNAIVFQRINECDERKGTKNLNAKLSKLNKNVDINIYVSDWIKEIFNEHEMSSKISYVIKGGPNQEIYNSLNRSLWTENKKLKLVTHHWSSNIMKGFYEYKFIDTLLETKNKFNFEFTIIGNIPTNLVFNNTNILKPMTGSKLANELKQHHIYVTASQNEPSGNHHMEGALCGLPILFIDSGALPEYCNEYGVEFNLKNFTDKLIEIQDSYEVLTKKLKTYPYTFRNAAVMYEEIFKNCIEKKENILIQRNKTIKFIVLVNLYKSKVNLFLYNQIVKFRQFLGRLRNKLEYA